jgi:hypothetical protein
MIRRRPPHGQANLSLRNTLLSQSAQGMRFVRAGASGGGIGRHGKDVFSKGRCGGVEADVSGFVAPLAGDKGRHAGESRDGLEEKRGDSASGAFEFEAAVV